MTSQPVETVEILFQRFHGRRINADKCVTCYGFSCPECGTDVDFGATPLGWTEIRRTNSVTVAPAIVHECGVCFQKIATHFDVPMIRMCMEDLSELYKERKQ